MLSVEFILPDLDDRLACGFGGGIVLRTGLFFYCFLCGIVPAPEAYAGAAALQCHFGRINFSGVYAGVLAFGIFLPPRLFPQAAQSHCFFLFLPERAYCR